MTSPLLLLVDDAPELGVIVATLGKRAGCAVDRCPDVPAGWAYLQDRAPDLVLLDVNLPGVSGLELCRKVRNTPRLASLPVALFSHWGMPEDVLAGLEAGVDFLFSKELIARPDRFRDRLLEILAYTRGQGPGRSLGWREAATFLSLEPDWARTFNRAWRHPALGPVGPEVKRLLLRRALSRAFSPRVSPEELEAWAPAAADGLDVRRVPPDAPPGAVAALFTSVAEQVWCLLGTEATAPFLTALAPRQQGRSEPPGGPLQ